MEQSRRNLEIGCSNLISINHRLGGHLPFSWWFMLTSIQSDVTLVVDAFQSKNLASFTMVNILALKGSGMKSKNVVSLIAAALALSCLGITGCGSDNASTNETSSAAGSNTVESSSKSTDSEKEEIATEYEDSIEIYDDLAGTYSSPAGITPQFENFTVLNVDPELGEFEISFTQGEIKSQGAAENIYEPARVEAAASVFPRNAPSAEGAMDDGYVYEFEATGTSDKGSGTATLKGYISVNKSGKPIIYIEQSKISTVFTASTDQANGWDGKNDIYTAKDMTLTKQS